MMTAIVELLRQDTAQPIEDSIVTPMVPGTTIGDWCAAAGGLNSPPLASPAGQDTRPSGLAHARRALDPALGFVPDVAAGDVGRASMPLSAAAACRRWTSRASMHLGAVLVRARGRSWPRPPR